uniref:Uncharacterized protein n=1 Tax=Pithovirus LCPAC101 TaxID=2506586 RepID=A0A481Z3U5_9VIRU|nr:MAG: hypothetical protein LCPAC101_03260 [Pithovirus LCPAC101]
MDEIDIVVLHNEILKYFEKDTQIKIDYLEYCNKHPNKKNMINVILPGNKLWSLPPDVIFEIKKPESESPMKTFLFRDNKNTIDLSDEIIDKSLIIALLLNLSYNTKIKYEYLYESYLFSVKYLHNSKFYLDRIYDELKINVVDDNYTDKKVSNLNMISLDSKYAIMMTKIYLNKHLIEYVPKFIDDTILNVLVHFPYTLCYVYQDLLKHNIWDNIRKRNIDEMTKKAKKRYMKKINKYYRIQNWLETYNVDKLLNYEDNIHKRHLLETNADGVEYVTIKSIMDDLHTKTDNLKHVLTFGVYIKKQYITEYGHLPDKINVCIDNKYVDIFHYTLEDYRFLCKCIRIRTPCKHYKHRSYR